MDQLWDATRTAEYLGMSVDWVYREAGAQRLPATKFGHKWRFRRADLDAWIEAHMVRPVGV